MKISCSGVVQLNNLPQIRRAENFLTLSEVALREPLEVLEWKQNGVQHAVFSKLRRGGYALEYELDLHQKTVKEAQQEVFTLFQRVRAQQWRCVLISHGFDPEISI